MDLSKFNDDDYGKLKKGDISGMSDAGYQEYKTQYQQMRGAQTQAANPTQAPDAADKAAQGGNPNAKPISLYAAAKGGSPGDLPDPGAQSDPVNRLKTTAKVGIGAGMALGGSALAGGGMLADAAVNAGGAGLQKYLSNKIDQNTDSMQGVAGSAALGGLGSLALSGASKLSQWLGDKAMKSSIGLKDAPGVGTRLADMGVWGTKGMMADQVAEKLPEAENQVQSVIGGIPGSAPGNEIRDAVSAKGLKFLNPDTGLPFEGKETSYNQVRDLTDKMTQNQYSPQALLKLKRASDYEGYTASGNPATSLKAELEQAQANKARELLDNMSSGASKEALANEQALLLAKKPLEKAGSIPSSLGALFFQKAPALVGSTVGQAATKAGNVGEAVSDPQTLQGLFGLLNASQNKQPQQPQQ